MRSIVSFLFVLALSACGGGSSGTASIKFSTSVLELQYNENQGAPSQSFTAAATDETNKDIFLSAEVTGEGVAMPIYIFVDQVTRNATINVLPKYPLKPGTYAGTIIMKACVDQACTSQLRGSPHIVSYTVKVRPNLKPAVSSMSLAAVESGATDSSFAFVSRMGGSGVTASVSYDGAQAGWIDAQLSGESVLVKASAATLPAGKYTARITLTDAAAAQSVIVPVSLTVASGLSVPENAALRLDTTTTASQLEGTIGLAFSAGTTAKTWTAASDQAWLKLAQASGSAGSLPAWSLDLALIGQLANNAHHKVNVRITTDSAIPARTYTLDLHKVLAELKGLDSLALLAGQAGDVLLYGTGFDQLAGGVAALSVAGAQPTALARISDRVMRLTLPALPVGSYPVSIKHATGLAVPGKPIHVTGREEYAYEAFNTQGRKAAIIWDAVSKSAFVANATMNSVMRYALVNGRFQLVATRSFSNLDSIAMTPDRSALVMSSALAKVHLLSPVDLSTRVTHTLSANYTSPQSMIVPLTISGDNRLLSDLGGWLDLDTGTRAEPFLESDGFFHTSGQRGNFGAVSGNGMRLIRPDSGSTSPAGPIVHIDMTQAKFIAYPTTAMTPSFYRYAVDHEGNNWAFNNQVVDFDMNLKGKYAVPASWTASYFVFSRNGSRLYVYSQILLQGAKPRIYVFDTSKAMITSINFPLLGFFEAGDLPNCPYVGSGGSNLSFQNCHTIDTKVAIADDDLTLFLAGEVLFTVAPIPAHLRSIPGTAVSAMKAQAVIRAR